MTDRLDKIEAILERTVKRAEANRIAITQLHSTVNSLVQVVEIH